MSAQDQAFIKAYAKEAGGPAAALSARAATERPRASIKSHSRTVPSASVANSQIENLYADGALYRLEVPKSADVPPPHYLPPASQHRTVQRRIPGRHRQAVEPQVAVQPAAAEEALPVRRTPARGLAEIARRLSHYLPPAPNAELAPEVLVVEDNESQTLPAPALPTAPASSMVPPSPPVPNKSQQAGENLAAALNLPISELAPPVDHVPTLMEVCTPWETVNDAISGSLVILSDEPAFGAVSVPPQVDLALDPILEPGYRSPLATHEIEHPSLATAPSSVLQTPSAPVKKTHRIDPPQQAIEAPHFGKALERQIPPSPAVELPATPATDPVVPPLAALTPEETASLMGIASDAPAVTPEQTPAPEYGAAAEPLVPMWEVDRFQWPSICERLLKDEQSYFAQAGGKLVAAAKDGLKTLGITGSRRGEGRTTLALCLARCAAQSGLNVAMIDADFTRPQLAAVIGLEVAYGWQDAAQGKIPLPEAAVRSLADKITVLPLETSSVSWPLSLSDKRVSALIRTVAQTHDLVIVDLGPMSGGSEPLFAVDEAAPLDAVIVLRDLRYATPSETQAIGQRLHESGVEAIGIAENFVAVERARV